MCLNSKKKNCLCVCVACGVVGLGRVCRVSYRVCSRGVGCVRALATGAHALKGSDRARAVA